MCVAYAKCKSSRYATLYIVCIILVTISVKSDHVVTYENVCLNSYKSMLKPYQINIPVFTAYDKALVYKNRMVTTLDITYSSNN